jgi:hypothetical protein
MKAIVASPIGGTQVQSKYCLSFARGLRPQRRRAVPNSGRAPSASSRRRAGASPATEPLVLGMLGREVELDMTLVRVEPYRLVEYTTEQPGLPAARHCRHFAEWDDRLAYRIVVEYRPRPGWRGPLDRPLCAGWSSARCTRRSPTSSGASAHGRRAGGVPRPSVNGRRGHGTSRLVLASKSKPQIFAGQPADQCAEVVRSLREFTRVLSRGDLRVAKLPPGIDTWRLAKRCAADPPQPRTTDRRLCLTPAGAAVPGTRTARRGRAVRRAPRGAVPLQTQVASPTTDGKRVRNA